MKIGARLLNLWLDTSSGPPSDPNVVSRPRVATSDIFSDFMILLDSSHDS